MVWVFDIHIRACTRSPGIGIKVYAVRKIGFGLALPNPALRAVGKGSNPIGGQMK